MKHTLKSDILFLIMVFAHLSATLLFSILHIMGINSNLSSNQSLIISQFLILIPVIIYLIATKTNPVKLIRFKKIDVSTIMMTALFTVLIMPLVSFLNALSMLFAENEVMTLTSEMTGNPFLVNLFLLAILPAISEEFVFRGVLFHTYRKSSVLYGVVLSGIVFGLMHLNFNQFSYAFVIGIIFALLIEATGSIYTTMIAHFIINGSSVWAMAFTSGQTSQELQAQITQEYLMIVVGLYGMIAVVTTVMAIGVYIWIIKHCKREEHMRAVFWIRNGEDKFSIKKAISIPLIIGVIVCLAYMGYSEAAGRNSEDNYNIEEPIEKNTLDNTLNIAVHTCGVHSNY
ncbi:CPBP family intramembrane glutamic endopeptidase [Konateibacter massiliensis]|uniref:CPBP family intramembrane glutamic endopeptidase n=1 Tax=Konateibacter massiliensis TaxID=2002841 RepID=UPI000C15ABEC|nr:type II CAAX endopeptidase family protein [Konateibacter massiliensis]